MRDVIKNMDFAHGGDGLIQFSEFILAACQKKHLLISENIIKEFTYLDVDKDGVIGRADIHKFLTTFTGKIPEPESIETMLDEIIEAYKAETEQPVPEEEGAND